VDPACQRSTVRQIEEVMTIPITPVLHKPATIDAADVGAGAESSPGLTSEEARHLLDRFGPNSMPDTSSHPARMAIEKLWAPIPRMLEAAIVLQIFLGEHVEAGIIAVLLLFNAALGYFQESRAQATLTALKSRLAMTASVRRDGVWKNHPAADLAPGEIRKWTWDAKHAETPG
jgi:H+-transporting ATPase